MTFWEHFLHVLPHRPKQALAALYWHVTRRKVRARNRLRVASVDLPFAYSVWIDTRERTIDGDREIAASIQKSGWCPQFSVILHGPPGTTTGQLSRSVISIQRQIYRDWNLVDAPLQPLSAAISSAVGDYVIPLRAGDVLSDAALLRLAEALQMNRKAAILYGDQDQLDERGQRTRPWFKPRWNEEMFLAQDYLADIVAIETGLACKSVKNTMDLSELLLVASSSADGAIVHVPHILCHVAPRSDDHLERLAAVGRHLEPAGADCSVGPFGTIKVLWPLPNDMPLVSIIVPTKDKLDLLRPCIESILTRTSYQNFEILIVDNGSVERRTARYLRELAKNVKIRIIDYPNAYNFSAINNFAVRHARGSYLCLLNNDTEVIEPAWLTEMLRYAVRSEVGAVGAKLLYEDGSIQHAGVVIGIGGAAGHAHRFLPANEPGYFRQPHVAQFVSAVTAACLIVDKSKFIAVGGLDEAELAVAFNDVDLCLKLEAAGWRNVYVPHAVLLHHESKSRGNDSAPKNIQRYLRELAVLQARWGTKTYDDPLHSPNLDRYSETYSLPI